LYNNEGGVGMKKFNIVLVVSVILISLAFYGQGLAEEDENFSDNIIYTSADENFLDNLNYTSEAESYYFYYKSQNNNGYRENIEFKKFDGVYTLSEIKADEGNNITINYTYDLKKGNFGIAILDPDYEVIKVLTSQSEERFSFDAVKSGMFKIRCLGKNASGSAEINVEIINDDKNSDKTKDDIFQVPEELSFEKLAGHWIDNEYLDNKDNIKMIEEEVKVSDDISVIFNAAFMDRNTTLLLSTIKDSNNKWDYENNYIKINNLRGIDDTKYSGLANGGYLRRNQLGKLYFGRPCEDAKELDILIKTKHHGTKKFSLPIDKVNIIESNFEKDLNIKINKGEKFLKLSKIEYSPLSSILFMESDMDREKVWDIFQNSNNNSGIYMNNANLGKAALDTKIKIYPERYKTSDNKQYYYSLFNDNSLQSYKCEELLFKYNGCEFPINTKEDKITYKEEKIKEDDFQKKFTLNTNKNKLFTLDNSCGSVKIVKGEGKNIEIEADITILNKDKEYAKEISNSIIKINHKELKVISEVFNNFGNKNDSNKPYDKEKVTGIQVDYFIKIPEGININIKNSYGDLYIKDINGKASINNYSGDTELQGISGELEVKSFYGDIEINKVGGKVDIDSYSGDAAIYNIEKDLKLKNQYGDIQVDLVKGSANINSYNGNVVVKNIQGKLSVDNKYGDITAEEVKKDIDIKGYNGGIKIENSDVLGGNVCIENQYGDVSFSVPKEQKGYFRINTDYGEIESKFDLDIKKDGSEECVNQKIGQNDRNITIYNENGSVKLTAN
jgi:hypothetical protein